MAVPFRAYEVIKKMSTQERRFFRQHWIHNEREKGHVLERMFDRLCDYADNKKKEVDMPKDKFIKAERRNELYYKILDSLIMMEHAHDAVVNLKKIQNFFVLKDLGLFDFAGEQLEEVLGWSNEDQQLNFEMLALQVKGNFMDDMFKENKQAEIEIVKDRVWQLKVIQYEASFHYDHYLDVAKTQQSSFFNREPEKLKWLLEYFFNKEFQIEVDDLPLTPQLHLQEGRILLHQLHSDWKSEFLGFVTLEAKSEKYRKLIGRRPRMRIIMLVNFMLGCIHYREWEKFDQLETELKTLIEKHGDAKKTPEGKLLYYRLIKHYLKNESSESEKAANDAKSFLKREENILQSMSLLELNFSLMLYYHSTKQYEMSEKHLRAINEVKEKNIREDIKDTALLFQLVLLAETGDWEKLEVISQRVYYRLNRKDNAIAIEKTLAYWFIRCAEQQTVKGHEDMRLKIISQIKEGLQAKKLSYTDVFIRQWNHYFNWLEWLRSV